MSNAAHVTIAATTVKDPEVDALGVKAGVIAHLLDDNVLVRAPFLQGVVQDAPPGRLDRVEQILPVQSTATMLMPPS